MCTSRWWLPIGAGLGGIAVILGAFAAHGLDGFLVEKYAGVTKVVAGQNVAGAVKYLADFRTAAEYQMYHAIALMVVGLLSERRYGPALAVAGTSFLLGILLFSGSLYALVLTGITKLGMITPIGGLAFIVGWFALAAAACPCGPKVVTSEEGTASTATTTSPE